MSQHFKKSNLGPVSTAARQSSTAGSRFVGCCADDPFVLLAWGFCFKGGKCCRTRQALRQWADSLADRRRPATTKKNIQIHIILTIINKQTNKNQNQKQQQHGHRRISSRYSRNLLLRGWSPVLRFSESVALAKRAN